MDTVMAMRRTLAAQLAVLVGPERVREQVERLVAGELDAIEAEALRADLDTMASLLIGN